VRIVAGEWKGRRIAAPKGMAVRPTPERVREAWMSILQDDLPLARVFDLFAGTGALGLEALSRGAEFVDFVENDPRSLRTLEENIRALDAGERCTIHRSDALDFASRLTSPGAPHASRLPVNAARLSPNGAGLSPLVIAFADPPYRLGLAARLASLWLAAPFSTILGVEHEATETLPEGGDRRRYGDTALTIYRT
jgi:16S rRNA (guanine966-N2)-methyltransferase